MERASSTLRSSGIALACFVGVILVIEIAVRIAPIHYFEEPEAFLILSARNQVEGGKNNYPFIIMGDSRSMSILPGYGPNKASDVYNFSLPAMGSRYYPHFIRNYLKAGNRKPDAVIFSASPVLLMAGEGAPVADPSVRAYVEPHMGFFQYLYARSIGRLTKGFEKSAGNAPEQSLLKAPQDLEWIFFEGRLPNMFPGLELAGHYTGVERLYVFSATAPHAYRTYRRRAAILNLIRTSTYDFKPNQLLTGCSCAEMGTPVCLPPSSALQDNRITEELRARSQGGLNITDRIQPDKLLALTAAAPLLKKERAKELGSPAPGDYSTLEKFITELADLGIDFIYVDLPEPEYVKNMPQFRTFDREIPKIIQRHPNAVRLAFPRPILDDKYYLDQIHVNCDGSRVMSEDFNRDVMPQVRKFAAMRKGSTH